MKHKILSQRRDVNENLSETLADEINNTATAVCCTSLKKGVFFLINTLYKCAAALIAYRDITSGVL